MPLPVLNAESASSSGVESGDGTAQSSASAHANAALVHTLPADFFWYRRSGESVERGDGEREGIEYDGDETRERETERRRRLPEPVELVLAKEKGKGKRDEGEDFERLVSFSFF